MAEETKLIDINGLSTFLEGVRDEIEESKEVGISTDTKYVPLDAE